MDEDYEKYKIISVIISLIVRKQITAYLNLSQNIMASLFYICFNSN